MRKAKNSHKFMQVLSVRTYRELERIAWKRGITVQELLRCVIVPDWMLGSLEISKTLRRTAKTQLRRNRNRRRSLGAKNGRYRDKGRSQKIRAGPSSTTRP